jgi:hypothetical protein
VEAWEFHAGCGTGLQSVEDQRGSFAPVGVFTIPDHSALAPGFQSTPRLELFVCLELNRSAGEVMRSFGEAGMNCQDFVFEDGGTGLFAENGPFTTVLRREGRRFAKLQALNLKPSDRDRVLHLAAGLKMVAPSWPERRSAQAKQFNAQGVTITYPGDWTMAPDSLRARSRVRVLAGRFSPTDRARGEGAKRGEQLMPDLHMSVQRLDEVEADLNRMKEWQPPEAQRIKEVYEYDDRPFTTDSGWKGQLRLMTMTSEGPNGRGVVRSFQYVLPMPDGVMALCFGGGTSTNKGNTRSAEVVEEVWRKIVASARFEPAAVGRATGSKVVSD